MPEWKMNNLESDRKVTPWKMTENIGNAHPGKCQKNHTLENGRKITTGKCKNGKYTTWKMIEKSHPRK